MSDDTLLDLSRQACEACGQNIDQSAEWLLEAVEADEQAGALKAELLRRGALRMVYEVRDTERRTVKAGNPGRCNRGASAVASASGVFAQTILDMTIGNSTLGKMTGADLDPWIENAAVKERGWGAMRRFYARVREQTPDDKTVEKAVGAENAQRLWKEVTGADDPTAPIEKIGHGEGGMRRAGPSE